MGFNIKTKRLIGGGGNWRELRGEHDCQPVDKAVQERLERVRRNKNNVREI